MTTLIKEIAQVEQEELNLIENASSKLLFEEQFWSEEISAEELLKELEL